MATATIGAAAFQIDPEVRAEVATTPTGLWVPASASGDIVHLDAQSGSVTARVNVSEVGAELTLAEREQGVVVVDRTSGQISLVDPGLHQVVRTAGGVPTAESLVDIGPESIVMADADQVVLADLSVTDSSRVSLFPPPRSVAADGEGGLVEDATDRIGIDPAGAKTFQAVSDGRLVRVADRVVVVDTDSVRTLEGEKLACFEDALADAVHLVGIGETDGASAWVVAVADQTVHTANLTSGECSAATLAGTPGAVARPVMAGGRVFVAERATGVVHVIDPERGIDTVHSVLPAGEMRLRAGGGFVVAYDLSSPLAAFLDADGVVQFADTSVSGRGITAVIDADGAVAVVDEGGDADGSATGADGGGAGLESPGPELRAEVLAAVLERDPVDEPVLADELVADFAVSSTTATTGEVVRFVDASTGSPDSWQWDFGDSTGAEGPEADKSWDEPGSYAVTLRVSNGDETDAVTLLITVVPVDSVQRLDADFVYSATVVGAGSPIEFEDRSDGDVERWRWDFGDGTTSAEPDATKSWDEPGTYLVRLTVANEQGSDSAAIQITVVEGLVAPVAVITASAATVDLGAPVRFVGSSATDEASYQWDFGDGRNSRGDAVTHVFLSEGTFTVTLRAENSAGSSTATVDIVVTPSTQPPDAAIGALPTVVEVGDVVTLASLSTNVPDSEVWSFGDGQSATGQRVTHSWASAGSYIVTLTATNSAGSNTVNRTVQVLAELPPPIAQVGDFVASPWVGQTTLFLDASVDATSWFWDFGDGGTSNAPDPLHTFTSPGQKIVTLTVTNRNGSDMTSVVVEPRLQPEASFVVSGSAIRAGESVVFTDTSVNAVSWLWDFGDGSTSTVRSPSHTYATTGTFDVNLTVRNSTGDESTAGPTRITVDPAPPRLTGITKLPVDTGSVITRAATTFAAGVAPSSGPIDLYRLDFGDGSAIAEGTTGTFSHAYPTAGTYTMSMQARGPLGDFSEPVTRTITVTNPRSPSVAISGVPASAPIGPVTLTGQALVGSGPIANWRWEIIQGLNQWNYTGRVVTHSFGAQGGYQIRLIADSPVPVVASAEATQAIQITIPPPPVITALIASPSTVTAGDPVTFTTTVTGSVATWEWDYEGAGFAAGGSVGEHIFNTAGTRVVNLRVTGQFGQQATASVTVTVFPPPDPTAPSASPSGAVPINSTVTFTSHEVNGLTGLTWNWTITRTGSTVPTAQYPDAGPSQAHTFTSAGAWTITVTAIDARGVPGIGVAFVTVQPPLAAGFNAAPTAVPNQIQFTDASTGPPVAAWSWNFGDGTTSTAQNPLVTYAGPGTYPVTLTVTSGLESHTTTQTVTVP